MVTTFSRGGSDITGSIVAKAVHADVYENWTDVSGFLVADPRIIKNPEAIEAITYKELRELSYMGASVLHEDAIFPVRKEGIPINIRNTNKPDDLGTWIVESTCRKPKHTITGIAGKKGFASINIEKDMMNSEIGFGRKVLQVFEDNNLSFEHMPSGVDTMTVFVHQSEFEHKEQHVISGIHRAVHPDLLDLESGLALIAVVGRGMRDTRGVASKVFDALAKALNNDNLRKIEAKDVAIRFAIRDGRIATEPFDLKMGDIRINMSGSTGLDQTIDYTARVALPAGSTGGILQSVNVGIGGTFTSPKITLGVKEAAEQAVKNVVDQQIQKLTGSESLGEEIRKQADNLRAEARKAGEKLVEAAQAQRTKLIDGAKEKGALAKLAAEKAGDKLVEEARKQADKLAAEADKQIEKLTAKQE